MQGGGRRSARLVGGSQEAVVRLAGEILDVGAGCNLQRRRVVLHADERRRREGSGPRVLGTSCALRRGPHQHPASVGPPEGAAGRVQVARIVAVAVVVAMVGDPLGGIALAGKHAAEGGGVLEPLGALKALRRPDAASRAHKSGRSMRLCAPGAAWREGGGGRRVATRRLARGGVRALCVSWRWYENVMPTHPVRKYMTMNEPSAALRPGRQGFSAGVGVWVGSGPGHAA